MTPPAADNVARAQTAIGERHRQKLAGEPRVQAFQPSETRRRHATVAMRASRRRPVQPGPVLAASAAGAHQLGYKAVAVHLQASQRIERFADGGSRQAAAPGRNLPNSVIEAAPGIAAFTGLLHHTVLDIEN